MIEAIEKRVELDADPDRVWRALTDARELAQWFPDAGAFDLAAQTDGAFVWKNHGSYAVRVEAFEPPTYLAWRWVRDAETDIDTGVTTLVEFRLLARDGGGTILDLRESGFERAEDRESNVNGWNHELGELADLVTS